jgi:hypothetical protein
MKLVMVHGRAQEGKDPEKLKQEWVDALHYGCARAQVKLPFNTIIEFPYYGDLLIDLIRKINTPLGKDINAKGSNDDTNATLRGEILMEIAAHAGITDSDVFLELGNKPIEKGPGNWEWVQAIMRTLDRIPGLNSRFIDAFTRDAFVYLSYKNVRAEIDAVVAAALGDGPCVVLSHSLGSVITYNVLRTRQADPSYPRLITVGSPLGVRAIKKYLDTPLVSPPCIKNWFNAYDDRDLVALVPLDANSFNVTPSIENKSDVQNFTDNRHGITGYLADPIVAKKIVEYLK